MLGMLTGAWRYLNFIVSSIRTEFRIRFVRWHLNLADPSQPQERERTLFQKIIPPNLERSALGAGACGNSSQPGEKNWSQHYQNKLHPQLRRKERRPRAICE